MSKMLYVKAFIVDGVFFSFEGRIICRTIVRWPTKRTVPQIIHSFVVFFRSFSTTNMEVSAQDESLNKPLFCSSNGCRFGESIAHFHTLHATFCLHFWFNLRYTHDLRVNEKMEMNFIRLFNVECLDICYILSCFIKIFVFTAKLTQLFIF